MTSTPAELRARLVAKLAEALEQPIPDSTARRIHGAVVLPGKATAVVGMRRAGKTTYLHQLRRERLARGVPRERLVYLNFEDEQLVGMSADQLHLVTDEYYRLHPAAREGIAVTWCLDEIQTVPGWERFVRRMLDTERVEMFVSGSSAALLSREIATAMRGRAWEVLVHPFALDEALRHQERTIPADPAFLSPAERSSLEREFLDYLQTGGFPEVQGLDAATARRVLRDYVDVTMLRDVMERHGVSNVAALRWLVRHLLGNAASPFSVEKFFRDLKSQGLRVSKDTVHALLAHLEDAFLVRVVWVESESERRRMVNPRKIYPIDPGLISVFDRSGRANLGHALETVVLLELERRRAEITYVRTASGYEVDFLARYPDGTVELLQVCADLLDRATAERESRALAEAHASFPNAQCRILTLRAETSEGVAGATVQPTYEWILAGAMSAGSVR